MSAAFSTSLYLPDDDATTRLGARIAPALRAGDCLLLSGPIGAGKTHLARSIIQTRLAAADLLEDVPSPTYTLVQMYDDTTTEIWHADLYRLSDPSEVLELGLEEALTTALTLVEWPDRLGFVPKGALMVTFEVADPGRKVTFSSTSSEWTARLSLSEMADG